MPAYNNGFPVTYPQFYPQYSQLQQFPQLNQQFSQQQSVVPQQQVQQQMMTPPTIHAEILQVESEQAADNYPVAAGSSQMMIKKDETEIYVKTAFANGQSKLDVYVKRPERPSKPVFDPDGYVTKDEFESRLNALLMEVKGNGNVRPVREESSKLSADNTGDQKQSV